MKATLKEGEILNLAKDYKNGLSGVELANKYKVSYQTSYNIINALRKAGADLPKRRNNIDYKKLAKQLS